MSTSEPTSDHEPTPSRTPPRFQDLVRDVIRQYRHEKESEAHQIFRGAAGHQPKGVVPQTVNPVSKGAIFA
ncbi:hypothetical protein C0989_009765 [Termitomyces sp. Mn162]|nr:hypothetical protein C0989_009765 [Termitomyces sp. Mn162]